MIFEDLTLLDGVQKTPALLGLLLKDTENAAARREFISRHYTLTCATEQLYLDFQRPDGGLMVMKPDGYALIHALLAYFDNKCVKQLLTKYPALAWYENPNNETPIHVAYKVGNKMGVSLCWQFVPPNPPHISNECDAIKQLALTLPNAWEMMDIPYEQNIIKGSKKFILLIQGPEIGQLMPKYITSMISFIKQNNISFASIGDGELPISLGVIQYRVTALREIIEDMALECIFFAHGYMQKDNASDQEYHAVLLSTPFHTRTAYVFDVLKGILPFKNIDVTFLSCHGGGASSDVNHLPGNESRVLSFAMPHQMMIANFGEIFSFHNTFFDSILENYLVNSLQGFITFPVIARPGQIEYLIDSCFNITSLLTESNIQAVTASICSKQRDKLPQHSTCE